MTQQFAAYGYDIVDKDGDYADVCVNNSCTVTASGDKKTRQMIHRMKRENPGAVIAMTGCFPQAFPEEAQKLSEVDAGRRGGEEKGAGLCQRVPAKGGAHRAHHPAQPGRGL